MGKKVRVTRCLYDQPFHSGDHAWGWVIDGAFRSANKERFISIDAVGYAWPESKCDLADGFHCVGFFSENQTRETMVFVHEDDMSDPGGIDESFPNVRVYAFVGDSRVSKDIVRQIAREEIKKVLKNA